MLKMQTLLSAEAVEKAGTIYTPGFLFEQCTGNVSVLLVSTAGSVTITQQCSFDNIHFFDAVTHEGTATGNVCSAVTVTTGTYVTYSPVLAKFARLKIVEGNVAASAISLIIAFSKEGA